MTSSSVVIVKLHRPSSTLGVGPVEHRPVVDVGLPRGSRGSLEPCRRIEPAVDHSHDCPSCGNSLLWPARGTVGVADEAMLGRCSDEHRS